MAMFVCRSCYAPTPPGVKPWEPFVCKCYRPDPKTKIGKRILGIKPKPRKEEE